MKTLLLTSAAVLVLAGSVQAMPVAPLGSVPFVSGAEVTAAVVAGAPLARLILVDDDGGDDGDDSGNDDGDDDNGDDRGGDRDDDSRDRDDDDHYDDDGSDGGLYGDDGDDRRADGDDGLLPILMTPFRSIDL